VSAETHVGRRSRTDGERMSDHVHFVEAYIFDWSAVAREWDVSVVHETRSLYIEVHGIPVTRVYHISATLTG
jgi:hypothetical protein